MTARPYLSRRDVYLRLMQHLMDLADGPITSRTAAELCKTLDVPLSTWRRFRQPELVAAGVLEVRAGTPHGFGTGWRIRYEYDAGNLAQLIDATPA